MTKQKIVVASKNPVKVKAVELATASIFQNNIEVLGANAQSGVSDQPMSNDETFQGAQNRASEVKKKFPNADYWVGIEGGIDVEHGKMIAFAWIVVLDKTEKGTARTASFELPDTIAQLINQGIELGDADDRVFGQSNSKQQNGAVGLLTNDIITRTTLYQPAVVMAFIPFMNKNFYFDKQK
ncbi:non-canonical purine NTP phosphatase [Prolixibacteraceae bacterium JC049]|nr:non-canonical purine NTP phosphatase [Prolixibacteraceae bacterium JC049]